MDCVHIYMCKQMDYVHIYMCKHLTVHTCTVVKS